MNGKAIIKDLNVGVYLLYASNDTRYDDITPLLIAIPTWGEEEGTMMYDVKVIPKHTPVPPGEIITNTPDGNDGGVKTGDKVTVRLVLSTIFLIAAAGLTITIIYLDKREQVKKDEDENKILAVSAMSICLLFFTNATSSTSFRLLRKCNDIYN